MHKSIKKSLKKRKNQYISKSETTETAKCNVIKDPCKPRASKSFYSFLMRQIAVLMARELCKLPETLLAIAITCLRVHHGNRVSEV